MHAQLVYCCVDGCSYFIIIIHCPSFIVIIIIIICVLIFDDKLEFSVVCFIIDSVQFLQINFFILLLLLLLFCLFCCVNTFILLFGFIFYLLNYIFCLLKGPMKNLSVGFRGLSLLKRRNFNSSLYILHVEMADEEITVDFQGLPC